ncbi:MAG: hypothetical protein HPY74_05970 [Firmicutes bacterium]|nr:hypothetical protein [Bacillota bacterium]
MRSEIRQKLIDAISDIDGRAYEPHAAGKDTEKPYLVIFQGTENLSDTWVGGNTTIEIFPCVSRTTFQKVDELAKKVISALDRQLIVTAGGEAFTCIYTGPSGEDDVDEDWDIITRRLKFAVLTFPSQMTIEPDPVAAVHNWTNNVFPELQLDPSTWALTDTTPAVYWRLADIRVLERWAAVIWMEAVIMGHILAPSSASRFLWVKKITERIALDARTYLTDGSPLFFQTVSADSQADHLKNGQIKLTVKYGILVSKPAAELIENIYTSGPLP